MRPLLSLCLARLGLAATRVARALATVGSLVAATLGLLAATPASAEIPLGTKLVDDALVDVTPEGLDSVEPLITALVPTEFAVPVDLSDSLGVASYSISSDNLTAFVNVDAVDVTPGIGSLDLTGTVRVRVNTAGQPARLSWSGSLFGIPASGTCKAHVRSVLVDVRGSIDLALVRDDFGGVDFDGDGTVDTNRLDATVNNLNWSWDATPDDIQLRECGALGTLVDILDFFGLDLKELVLEEVEDQVDLLLQDLPADIEPLVEEAFAGLVIAEEIDLLGAPLQLSLWPGSLDITPSGIRIGLHGLVDTAPDPCVLDYGIAGSFQTPGLPSSIVHEASPVVLPHVVAQVDDDLLNHFLYAVWSTGLLCVDLTSPDSPVDLPVPLDSNLLDVLAGPEAYADLFEETQPIGLFTDPSSPPSATVSGAHDLEVVVDPMGLVITSEVEGRQARLLNVNLSADVGADLAYDATTGELELLLDAGPGSIQPVVTYNEFTPDANGQIEGALSALIDTVVSPLLADLGSSLAFGIPNLEGFGLTSAVVEPSGDNLEHLGLYAMAGPVDYPSSGCGEKGGGCDTSGCTQGCSTSTAPAGLAFFLFPLAVAILRRR